MAALTCFPALQYGLLACVADVSFPFPGGVINKGASKRRRDERRSALGMSKKWGEVVRALPAVWFPSHAFFETVTINDLPLLIFMVPTFFGGGTRGGGGESI